MLVVVGHEQGRNGVGTDGRMVGEETIHRGHIVRAIPVDGGGQGSEVIELETGVDALVIVFLVIVSIPGLCDHEDVVSVAGGLVRRVAVVVPLLQQRLVGRIVVRIDAAADVLDRIQAETVDTHLDPLVCRCRQILEASVVFRIVGIAVVQVRHPVAEAAHVVEGFRRYI